MHTKNRQKTRQNEILSVFYRSFAAISSPLSSRLPRYIKSSQQATFTRAQYVRSHCPLYLDPYYFASFVFIIATRAIPFSVGCFSCLFFCRQKLITQAAPDKMRTSIDFYSSHSLAENKLLGRNEIMCFYQWSLDIRHNPPIRFLLSLSPSLSVPLPGIQISWSMCSLQMNLSPLANGNNYCD